MAVPMNFFAKLLACSVLMGLPYGCFANEENSSKKQEPEKKEKGANKGPEPLSIGNFSLPVPLQIAPLVAFGQLIVVATDLQFQLLGHGFWGNKAYHSNLALAILYGPTDETDIYLQILFDPANREGHAHSSGISDINLQFEYAFFTHTTLTSSNQATIVSAITFPTGESHKNPPTGFGAPSFFIGGTFSHIDRWWYAFVSTGALFPMEHCGRKFADLFYYQCGFEHVISAVKDRFVFAWMVELSGTYTRKELINCRPNPDTGGNVILITPSLWLALHSGWIFQGGVSFPVVQKLNGHQFKQSIGIYFSINHSI